jgi:hypothetical protein
MSARSHDLSCLALAVLLGVTAPAPVAAEDGSCPEDRRRAVIRQAVGVWEVVSEVGGVEGLAEVREILGGCAFDVVRHEAGVEVARALIYLDPVTDRWVERWVSRLGATAELEIQVADDGLVLTGTIHDSEGAATPGRLEVDRGSGNEFTTRLYLSLDGGETWEPAQTSRYRRRGSSEDLGGERETAAAQTVPAAPRPPVRERVTAAEPPAAAGETGTGAVTVRSQRTRYQPPAATVTLESPMMLEVELGPVDALPEGTAWRTTETAVYLVDEIRMPQVSASRRERRGKVELEVTVNLRTTAMQRRVDIEVELLSGDASVGRERADNIALGKLIGSHDPRVGRPTTLRFSLDEGSFKALFADGMRPSARITVTVK